MLKLALAKFFYGIFSLSYQLGENVTFLVNLEA